jgi:membrane protein implicated in regulation of membrane protease activity
METLIYSICFGTGLVFAVASAFLGHLFGGHDVEADHPDLGCGGHAEAGLQDDGMPGISVFSPTVITSFVTAFGGLGLILSQIEATRKPWISAPLAAAGAVAVALAVLVLFSWIFRNTQSSSESHVASLIGTTGTVITPIPASGVGEVAYVQAGTRYTAPARDAGGDPVPNGQTVVIVRIVGCQLYVVPV